MIESAPRIVCNSCRVPLSSVSEPQGSDLLSCPNCRISDTYDNVMLELGQRTADALLRAIYRPVPSRIYRFALLFSEGGHHPKPTRSPLMSTTSDEDRRMRMRVRRRKDGPSRA